MNDKPIEHARNSDLRGSWSALQRAAIRARELAARTGTELIVSRNGVIERIRPDMPQAAHSIQEQRLPYRDQP